MMVLRNGCCNGSRYAGGMNSGIPLFIRITQSECSAIRWCIRHNSTRFPRSVGPKSSQEVMWCNAAKLSYSSPYLAYEIFDLIGVSFCVSEGGEWS